MLITGAGPLGAAAKAASPYATSIRLSFSRSRRTWARSYWACCTSQPSSVPPKTFDSLTAISGDMPRFPFASSESVLRVTPRASAARVMVKPKGSIHSCNTTRPGCGGVFIVMGCCVSVVIDIITVPRAIVKAENPPPVGPNVHGPKAFHLAFERMQPEPRHVHMGQRLGRREALPEYSAACQDGRGLRRSGRPAQKPFQSLVADCPSGVNPDQDRKSN